MNLSLQNKATTKLKGTHIVSLCSIVSEEALKIQDMLESCRLRRQALLASKMASGETLRALWEEYTFWLESLHRKYLKSQFYVENITTTEGRTCFAQRLGGDTTYTGIVNYGALGTSNTAAAVGDTQLGTETYRKALSSGTNVANVTYLENFYTAAEVSGTFDEFGFFIDGGAGANSGQIFNRFTQNVVKAVTESLNVQSTITWNDA